MTAKADEVYLGDDVYVSLSTGGTIFVLRSSYGDREHVIWLDLNAFLNLVRYARANAFAPLVAAVCNEAGPWSPPLRLQAEGAVVRVRRCLSPSILQFGRQRLLR